MRPPPAGQFSWACSTPSPSPYTATSTNPKASVRNRISPRASSARRLGHTFVAGICLSVMPSVCVRGGRAGLDDSELLGEPAGRRAADELAEVPVQVGLVVVAAVCGQIRERPVGPGHDLAPGTVEPDHPGRLLGRQADLGAEPVEQMAR